MRRALELSITLSIIGVFGFFGVRAIEKSILSARKKVLISNLHKISRHLEAYYAEKNQLPDVATIIRIMGLSVCPRGQSLDKDCIQLKRIVDSNRRKLWALASSNGTIYFNSKTGESSAIVKGRSGLQRVAKVTFNEGNGLSILKHYAD